MLIMVMGACVGLMAQTDSKSSANDDVVGGLLQEVVITSTGTQHLLKDAPVQTEVISRRQLQM